MENMKKVWEEIVFKLLHQGYDLLNEKEIKDLDTYLGWKIKKTLRGKKLMCIIPEGEAGWFHIVDDLRNEMVMYILEKRDKLLELNAEAVWKKFNNHSYQYLQWTYYRKESRDSQFAVCGAVQDTSDRTYEDLEERYTMLGDIPPQILDLSDGLVEDEDENFHGDVTIKDGDGNIIKVVKMGKSKKNKK